MRLLRGSVFFIVPIELENFVDNLVYLTNNRWIFTGIFKQIHTFFLFFSLQTLRGLVSEKKIIIKVMSLIVSIYLYVLPFQIDQG